MERHHEPQQEDERVVELETDDESLPPPTIDPDERVEADDPEPPIDDERRV